MPAIVTLDAVSASTPDGRNLFNNLTLALGDERVGLVGRNGVGKSTLVRLVLGEQPPTTGTVVVRGRIGVLRQAFAPAPEATVAELLDAAEPLARLQRIADGVACDGDLDAADWTLEARLAAALADVGLEDLALDRPAARLSGGQVTRLRLAGLLAAAPDLLILDEPTNNLDAEARAMVADTLGRRRGGALVVSHDRELLRRMDRIVELTSLGAQAYGGGYDLYAMRKAQAEQAARQALDAAEQTVARVARETQAAAERRTRRDAAGRRARIGSSDPKILLDARAERAEASGGHERRLAERLRAEAADALARAQARVEQVRTLGFDLPSSGLAAGRTVLAIEGATFAYPGQAPLFSDLSLQIAGPERVAVVGPNGRGKTTLIRLAAGELAPTAGRVVRGVATAFLDQQTAVLREEETLLEAFLRLNPGAGRNRAQAALARFLFRNVAAEKLVAALSGGERLRAALACVLMGETPPQLLILDEPTNHLDLDSIAAVEAALQDYDGAILAVSHDPAFLAAIGVEREVAL